MGRIYRGCLILFAFVAALFIGLVCLWFLHGPPSDQQLKKQFEKHSAEFYQLREMMLQDKLGGVSDCRVKDYYKNWWGKWSQEYIGPDGMMDLDESQMLRQVGLSEERYHLYLSLLREAGVNEVNGGVTFIVYTSGFSRCFGETIIKGIVYCDIPPSPIVEDTESASNKADLIIVYARIRDKWYIMR